MTCKISPVLLTASADVNKSRASSFLIIPKRSTTPTATGIPRRSTVKNAKALLIQILAHDSASWGTDGLYFAVGPTSTNWYALAARPKGGDVMDEAVGAVPTNGSGHIWYQVNASGTNTMQVWLRCWGFWI